MNICVIGTGYVGLVAGTCFAEMGNNVICVDSNLQKIDDLKKGIIPIYEPGLEDLIETNLQENRLIFTDNLTDAVQKSHVCFIAVGTPSNKEGDADISIIEQVSIEIAKAINEYKVIVNKSTVPVGTLETLENTMKNYTKYEFNVISNPEFLKQGAAVEDFLKPDRVIIGSNSEKAAKIMKEIYEPFVRTGNPILEMDIKSAEMAKYAANAFLAVKISYINEIANICEKVGANIESVRKGLCSDQRIGNKFLFPGLGYGGSCFPKDVKALIKTAENNNYDSQVLKAAHNINMFQREAFVKKITERFSNDLKGRHFAMWGLSFKPKTDDMRDAPSITIIQELLKRGATITVYDPKAINTAKSIFHNEINYADSSYKALNNADALILVTEWNEFRNPDFNIIKNTLNNPIIFDGRNQFNEKTMEKLGFEYYCIGKN